MKRRILSLSAIFMICAVGLLAVGCGVRINGKEYEIYKAKPNSVNNIFGGIGTESTDTQEFTQEEQGAELFKLSISAGNIDIEKSSDSTISVIAEKKVRGASADIKKEILDNMNLSIDRSGDNIELAVKTKDGKDFWNWHKNNYKSYQVTVNLDLKVPDSVKGIDADTGAGNVSIESLPSKVTVNTGAGNINILGAQEKVVADTGAGNITVESADASMDISTGTGNINIDDSSARGAVKIDAGAGNVDFSGKIDDIDSFVCSTGVGNVGLDVPENTKMTLEADTGVGNLSGYFIQTDKNNKNHFKGDINGGGASVKVNTGAGNISVDRD